MVLINHISNSFCSGNITRADTRSKCVLDTQTRCLSTEENKIYCKQEIKEGLYCTPTIDMISINGNQYHVFQCTNKRDHDINEIMNKLERITVGIELCTEGLAEILE